jgi:hypothetical protein
MKIIFIFLVFFLSLNVGNASIGAKSITTENSLAENQRYDFNLNYPKVLINKCEHEQKEHFSNGSCLMLGIYAIKSNYFDLFKQIETLCIQKVRENQLFRNEATEAFLYYYPKCKYVLQGQQTSNISVKTHLKDELKILVRFLNN